MQSSKGEKRGPAGELEGPRPKDPAGEPVGEGGRPPAEAGGAIAEGEPSLTDARGAVPGDAADAAGVRDDARLDEEDPTRQPGQGGGETDERTVDAKTDWSGSPKGRNRGRSRDRR